MQISRHWRLNPLRYRLQGVRYENGAVSLQARPQPMTDHDMRDTRESVALKVKAAMMSGR